MLDTFNTNDSIIANKYIKDSLNNIKKMINEKELWGFRRCT